MNSYLLKDYSYTYPESLVAKEPLTERHASKMMLLDCQQQSIKHDKFSNIVQHIPSNALMVFNESKVIPARLYAQKPSGGNVEILLVEPLIGGLWKALAKPLKSLQEGMKLKLFRRSGEQISDCEIVIENWIPKECIHVRLPVLESIEVWLQDFGEIPLPPYLRRDAVYPMDETRYQTIYAKQLGSVAAPTAGLHFTEAILNQLKNKGVEFAKVALHVGPGTFLPVQCVDIREHPMHVEHYKVSEENFEKINQARNSGRPIIHVGTTSLRVVETLFQQEQMPLEGTTDLFIKPAYQFKATTGLLTNFHQPESTLLVLVATLLGDRKFLLKAYAEAIDQQYRLFSYGDCMLVL